MNDLIKISSLTKEYGLGMSSPIIKGLNDIIGGSGKWVANSFKAIKNINLNLKKGEVLGVIGKNGAGKSTLLKLITGVTKPTSGSIKVNGKITPLLQLGAGFHPELTGKENIYLNGIILGMTKKEIDSKYEKILEFSELEKFINTPVKKYSSGMYVRLGFSIAIHTDPEIMIVDEVLAVGDQNFKDKSYNAMIDLKNSGATIIFVSHSMVSIRTMCSRVIWLKNGQIKNDGPPDLVINDYLKNESKNHTLKSNFRTVTLKYFKITGLNFLDFNNKELKEIKSNSNIKIKISYVPLNTPKDIHIRLHIGNLQYPKLFDMNSVFVSDKGVGNKLLKNNFIVVNIKSLPLADCRGPYFLSIDTFKAGGLLIDEAKRIGEFSVKTPWSELGFSGEGVTSWSVKTLPVFADFDFNFEKK